MNYFTPWRSLIEKLIVTLLIKKFPDFYGTQKLIIMWFPSWFRWIHPLTSSCTFKMVFSFPVSLTKLCMRSSSFPCVIQWLNHFTLIHLTTLIKFAQQYKIQSSLLYKFLQPPATFLPLRAKYFPRHLFSVSTLMWETKFHTHMRQQVELYKIGHICFPPLQPSYTYRQNWIPIWSSRKTLQHGIVTQFVTVLCHQVQNSYGLYLSCLLTNTSFYPIHSGATLLEHESNHSLPSNANGLSAWSVSVPKLCYNWWSVSQSVSQSVSLSWHWAPLGLLTRFWL